MANATAAAPVAHAVNAALHVVHNAPCDATFTLPGEDHTLGQLLVSQLQRDPGAVTFAACSVDAAHHRLRIQVVTAEGTTPVEQLLRAVQARRAETQALRHHLSRPL